MSTIEITIQRQVDGGWPAAAVFSRAGEFLPVRDEGRLELDLDLLRGRFTPGEYGKFLGKALFQDTLRDGFNRALAQAGEEKERLRILLTVEAPELKSLHWERLCAPFDGAWDFLSLRQETPFQLYLPSLASRRYPAIGRLDLRALVLIAGPDDLDGDYGLDPFDIPGTAMAVQEALGEIPSEIIAAVPGTSGPPSLRSLCEKLTTGNYPLLHVVCHGRYHRSSGDTLLYLPEDADRRRPITASLLIERLGRLQGGKGLPHFIFLSTCESASPEAEDGFGGLGQRLVRELGTPAALAMTGRVSIPTAGEMARAFYARLRQHGEPDRALGEALAGLMGRQDVTVPALYSRLGERPIFSQALDRPLTEAEIAHGLERLAGVIAERAPGLREEFAGLAGKLPGLAAGDPRALSLALQKEHRAALDAAGELSEQSADLSFSALALDLPLPPYDPRCPFRGLQAFGPEDREFFFGREALAVKLLGRLDESPFLAVLGPSGSGKSSLVLAGLVPILDGRSPGCPHAYLTPGEAPAQRLEIALAGAAPGAPLVVDQFEELFSLCRDETERETFIKNLLALAAAHPILVTMRADFWGDCARYPALKEKMQAHQELVGPLQAGELRSAIEQQAARVGLRFEAGLAETILEDVQPEPGAMPLLQHALLLLWQRRRGRWLRSEEYRSFGGIQKAIAHTADEIYRRWDEMDRERGRHIFIRLTRLEADPTPGVEQRDTRRRVSLEELVPAGSDPAVTREIVRQLADARLLVTGTNPLQGQEEVEVAHEALIRHWPRLRGWLDEDRAGLRMGEGVREAALEWVASSPDPRRLDEGLLVHRGGRLEDVLELAASQRFPFNQLEMDYLHACRSLGERERKARERRRNLAVGATLAAALVMALLGLWGLGRAGVAEQRGLEVARQADIAAYERDQAESQAATATNALGQAQVSGTEAANQAGIALRERSLAVTAQVEAQNQQAEAERQAQVALSRQLAAQSGLYLETDLDLSLLLAVQANTITHTSEAYDSLLTALQFDPHFVSAIQPEAGLIKSMVLSPDGEILAVYNEDNQVFLWDLANPKQPESIGILLDPEVSYPSSRLAISPQGTLLAIAVPWIQPTPNRNEWANFYLFDISDPHRPVQRGAAVLEGYILPQSIVFASQGSLLATGEGDGSIHLWDVSDPDRVVLLGNLRTPFKTWTRNLTLSPDGQMLATSGCVKLDEPSGQCLEQAAFLWDIREPTRPIQISTPALEAVDASTKPEFNPDGTLLAWYGCAAPVENNLCPGSQVVLWDLRDPTHPAELKIEPALTGPISNWANAVFSPDGKKLAWGGCARRSSDNICENSAISIWDVSDPQSPAPIGPPVPVANESLSRIAFRLDGSILAAGPRWEDVILWQISPDLRPNRFSQFLSAFPVRSVPLNTTQFTFNPDGETLVMATMNTAERWDIRDPANPTRLGSPPGSVLHQVTGLAFSEDGKQLVMAGMNNSLAAWDFSDPNKPARVELPEIEIDGGPVFSILDPPGQTLAVAVRGGEIFLANLQDPSQAARLPSPWDEPEFSDYAQLLVFSPDRRILAARYDEAAIHLWEISDFQQPRSLGTLAVDSFDPYSLAFSPDGKTIAVGGCEPRYLFDSCSQGTVYLWDLNRPDFGNPTRLQGAFGTVFSLAYNPAGTILVSGGCVGIGNCSQGAIFLWQITPEGLYSPLKGSLPGFSERVVSLSFSPNGKILASKSVNGRVILWDFDLATWIQLACERAGRNLTPAEWQQLLGDRPYQPVCP